MKTTVATGYIAPSDKEVSAMSENIGLNLKAPDFIKDVCNIQAEGRFMTHHELTYSAQKMLAKTPIKQLREKNKIHYVRPDNNVAFSSYAEAEDSFTKEHFQLADQVRHAINELPSMEIPGSPLTQAVGLLKLLAEQMNSNNKEGDGEGNGGNENQFLQKLLSKSNIDQAKKTLKDVQAMSGKERDLLKTLKDLKKNKDKPENQKSSDNGGEVSDGTMTGESDKGKEIIEAASALSDRMLRRAIQLSRKLKSVSKLKTSKITEFKEDPMENDIKSRNIKSLNELGRIRHSQFALRKAAPGLFSYRAVTQQLTTKYRGKYTDKKQLLYALIDCSGSMRVQDGSRIASAAGILINRLMAVTEGDAEVYWRFFDTRCHAVNIAKTKDEAYESIRTVLNEGAYNGGGTNFDEAIKTSVEHIKELQITSGNQLVKPEIFLVTDGECSCRTTVKDLQGIKLHSALVYHTQEEELRNITVQSGGAYLELY